MQLASGTLLQGGKYRIIRTLGQGGFGITYEAEQVALKRLVAIKEFFMKDCCERAADGISVTIGTGAQRALVMKFHNKFLKEAHTIANFNHPNIVRILDIYEENGTAYYVMDHLSGGSLAEIVLNSGRLPEGKAIQYIREISCALKYIHEHSTVHLDVKPSNIILNAKGEAVLIDFGTSKHYDSIGEQTSTTPIGFSKGYAPLEQYREGDVSQFKPATDIYALGATLYTLVTGKVPPEASIVLEDGLTRIDGVSDVIWTAITRSMRPIRKDRPQSIDEFLISLQSVESGRLSETTVISEPKDQYYPLTRDGIIIIHTSHGKSWLEKDAVAISKEYDEIVIDTLVDDRIVCARNNNRYSYLLIEPYKGYVYATEAKYYNGLPLDSITYTYNDAPFRDVISNLNELRALVINQCDAGDCLLLLKKNDASYTIKEQLISYDDSKYNTSALLLLVFLFIPLLTGAPAAALSVLEGLINKPIDSVYYILGTVLAFIAVVIYSIYTKADYKEKRIVLNEKERIVLSYTSVVY